MIQATIDNILDWMKGTDLVEVRYEKDGESVALRLADAPAPLELPPSRLTPIGSPSVGVFRFSEPGRAAEAKKGARVAAKAPLGYVESGKTKVPVTSPLAGRLAEVLVEDGQGVDYGRPLFLVERD